MRVLKDKNDYDRDKREFVVLRASIRTVNGEVFHPETLARVHCVYNSWTEIAYEFIIDGQIHLKEVKPEMFRKAFRHAYKNEEKLWKNKILKH